MSGVEDKLRDLLAAMEKERTEKEKAEQKEASSKISEKDARAIRVISERFKQYDSAEPLHVGDIVKWKEGMRNRRLPRQDSVAIVTRVYAEPVYDEKNKESGSPQFRDPATVVLGLVDEDGDFVEFHFDGRRFQQASMLDVPQREVTKLRERLQLLNNVETFAPGDIVTWKEGLRNKKHPVKGKAGIVVKVLDTPVHDMEVSSGSPYYREPLDIVVGIIDDDGDLICFHNDGRRFTHIPPL